MHIQQWPEEIIALNKELATGLHPKLEEELAKQPHDPGNFSERFGIIAAYCGVVMDGMYEPDQLVEIAGRILLPKLMERRENPNKTIIIH